MSETKKKAVLLLAFGGADSVDNVEPFIRNVLAPREPSPELIEDAKQRYYLIGGSSPIRKITETQAMALEGYLSRETNKDVKVYYAMKNWDPYIKDVIKQIKDDGVEEIIAIIMAPHTSKAATGGYNEAVDEAIEAAGGGIKVEYAPDWHTHWRFIDAIMDNYQTACSHYISLREKEKLLTIFTAHSLPKKLVEGDDYVKKIEETVEVITSRLSIDWRLAYQSKGGGGEWLGPTVEEVIDEAKELGKVGVIVVPLSFVAENVETLFDVDILFEKKARAVDIKFSRAPAVNTDHKFLWALVDVIKDRC